MSDVITVLEVYEIAFKKSNLMYSSILEYQASINLLGIAVLGWIITSEASRKYLSDNKSIRLMLQSVVLILFVYTSVTLAQRAAGLEEIYVQMLSMGKVLFKDVSSVDVITLAKAIPSRLPRSAYLGFFVFNFILFLVMFFVIRSCKEYRIEFDDDS